MKEQSRRPLLERSDQLLTERVGYLQEEAGLVFHGCRHICPDGSYMTYLQQREAAEFIRTGCGWRVWGVGCKQMQCSKEQRRQRVCAWPQGD